LNSVENISYVCVCVEGGGAREASQSCGKNKTKITLRHVVCLSVRQAVCLTSLCSVWCAELCVVCEDRGVGAEEDGRQRERERERE
jgi:hypothetical protein